MLRFIQRRLSERIRPHRYISGSGGNRHGTEEQHIAKTLTWLREKEPQLMVHVDKITTVGCTFLPGIAFRTLHKAKLRIAVLTHGDILSKQALRHQIALAEELYAKNCRDQFFPTAIFVVNVKDVAKQKQLRELIDAMFGAYYLHGMTHKGLVVSGIPNVGKSSLILPLTRGRTLAVKKKKHYHLPKVGPTAGVTLGIKSHVLQCPGQRQEITLYDTPGVREILDQKQCMEIVLRALHRHADVSEEPPAYVQQLDLTERVTNVDDFLVAVRAKSSDKQNVNHVDLIRSCNHGEYGGLIFSGHSPSGMDRVQERELQVDAPIVYRNEFAKELVKYGKNPETILHDPRLEGHRPALAQY